MKFRFLGTDTEIFGVARLTEFGQEVDLPPDIAQQTALPGGAPCIPEAAWKECGGDPVKARAALHEMRLEGALPTTKGGKD